MWNLMHGYERCENQRGRFDICAVGLFARGPSGDIYLLSAYEHWVFGSGSEFRGVPTYRKEIYSSSYSFRPSDMRASADGRWG